MVTLERLRADHAAAVIAFEWENREWFARSIPDRGDAWFAEFHERHRALLAEQEAGLHHLHVLVEDDGRVIGRVNLVDVAGPAGGTAELGYRIAEAAGGRGVATTAVTEVCRRAAEVYGLSALTAVTTLDNPASRAVLARTGFVPVGDIDLDGRPGTRYHRPLTPGTDPRAMPAHASGSRSEPGQR
ncbi:GNAT family N-acetyltransferase [Streptomyces calidiresistens]|uniref:GNAT family N-acetyltransferase n=1 Tax=Streptomyces calidiresistens TaxID=1485586 RepID=A0A7W3T5V1_9ACTN|nr:GNAT family N-acetyltransferase [Streptomyces calidiresistens]MBB0231206.1 GNAT family N-acetyltransferase [Streptomyces calidiresistens]